MKVLVLAIALIFASSLCAETEPPQLIDEDMIWALDNTGYTIRVYAKVAKVCNVKEGSTLIGCRRKEVQKTTKSFIDTFPGPFTSYCTVE